MLNEKCLQCGKSVKSRYNGYYIALFVIVRSLIKMNRLVMKILPLLLIVISYNSNAKSVRLGGETLEAIEINKIALYPEDIAYNSISNKFLVGSFRDGSVYEVNLDGNVNKIIDDDRLYSILGIQVDTVRNRLIVVSSDIGSSIRSHPSVLKKTALVGIYELSTGKNIHFINLGNLLPNGQHLVNGITMDNIGNIYITDSFSPVIYKIDINGKASIFLESNEFLGEGINLNGIVFHPDGYLIVVKKGEGILFKIPLDEPNKYHKINVPKKIIGGDGLLLVNNKELIVIANRASGVMTETVFSLLSNDSWNTAIVTDKIKIGNYYLTTGVIKKNKIYVIHSDLKSLIVAPFEKKKTLFKKATIQQVGVVK